MIPHLSTVNKDNQVIGSDTKYYIRFLESMADSTNYGELLYKAFATVSGGDRPFSLLFFFSLSIIFYQGQFSYLLENLPLLLSPLLIISTYFLTLRITRDHLVSSLAALITIPIHILTSTYAGLYANWFSLIWGYLVILYLVKLMDEPKKINYSIFSILLVILIFSHVQTWTIFTYVIALFLVVVYFKDKRKYGKLVFCIFLSLLPSILIDIARLLLIDNSGILQEISFASKQEVGVGIHSIHTIWDNLNSTTHTYLAGQTANPIILLLALFWLYVTKIRENYTIFFIIFLSLFSLPLLFGDKEIQSRFLLEIPFQVPAAIALMILKERIGTYITVAICLWLIVMSLLMASNFVLVIPQ
jgi:hypothetical protein